MKQCYCLLERFNNYFNRKIIKYDNLSDYEDHSQESFIPYNEDGSMTRFDFNPNDNVMTEIIVNNVPFDPDYFLLLDEEANIVQRWFVLEQKRNRQGQWIYTLRRDVVADNLENLWNAPIFVEKGMLQENDPFVVNSEGMSLNQIKKSETLLKDRSETAWIVGYMARNIGGSDINVQVPSGTVYFEYKTMSEIASYTGISEGTLTSLLNLNGSESNVSYFTNTIKMYYWLVCKSSLPGVDSYYPCHFDFNSLFDSTDYRVDDESPFVNHCLFSSTSHFDRNQVKRVAELFANAVTNNKTTWENNIYNIFSRSYYLNQTQLSKLKEFNGVYVKYNGQYYKFNASERGYKSTLVEDISNYNACVSPVVSETISNAASEGITIVSNVGEVLKEIELNDKEVIISLEEVADSDAIPIISTKISSSRNITGDQEFDAFAIPLNIDVDNNGTIFKTNEAYSRRIASAIGIEQDAKVYDLQLLPYCPFPSLISANNKIDITELTEGEGYDFIISNSSDIAKVSGLWSSFVWTETSPNVWHGVLSITLTDLPAGKTPFNLSFQIDEFSGDEDIRNVTFDISNAPVVVVELDWYSEDGPSGDFWGFYIFYQWLANDTNKGIILYLPSATFTTIINKEITISESKKVLSNCYMHRLVSPNYQGSFEFNIAKNGGKVSYFNVFCTYKPYTPIIKVAPNFEWLYGLEYQDNRGLLCAGDFSLPRVSDAWVNYQLNNKNYQNIFNRDIQHLDFVQGLEMRNQLVSGAVGIISDTAKGAAAGAFVGGGWGAVTGAVTGATASAIGYGIDVDTLARQHRENKQLAIDKYNYQLGNVKALPYTLTKVGSFDAISKIFPFIEEYCCSDKELEAFKNKIKYESMTVMRIGTLREYADYNSDLNYFKGSLIRNDEIADDPHILNAIYEELLKGVYI